jgi:glycosyltransferase involved in cell wall biosynthesis
MKKWIFSLALTLFVSLQNAPVQEMMSHDHDIIPQKFLPHENSYLTPNAVNADHLAVKGMKIEGFDTESLAKLNLAFKILEEVVNTEEFKDRVINFKNTKGEREFASNKGLTNEQIYAAFMEGRETLQQNTPGEMNFYLKLYNKSWSRVIGYTSANTNVIKINWKYFKNYAPAQVASNLAHEWTHKLGFDHRSAKEHDSAPYAIGYIIEDMASKVLKSNMLH